MPRARGHGDLQTADSESAPQEFHLRVDLTRPPSLVTTDYGAERRFNARLLTGRGVVYPRSVMAVPAVLPQYLLPGSRPLVPFENNRRIVFADGLIWLSKFSRRRHGRERFASHVVVLENTFFTTSFQNFFHSANSRQRIGSPGISPPRGSHPAALFGYDGLRRRTPLQRSTFDWTGCCLSAVCHGGSCGAAAVSASGKQAARPF